MNVHPCVHAHTRTHKHTHSCTRVYIGLLPRTPIRHGFFCFYMYRALLLVQICLPHPRFTHVCAHTCQNPKGSIIACPGLCLMSKSVPQPQPQELTHTQTHTHTRRYTCMRTPTPTHKLTTAWLLLSSRVLATLHVQLSSPTSPAHSLLELLGVWEPAGVVLWLTVWRRSGIYHMSPL